MKSARLKIAFQSEEGVVVGEALLTGSRVFRVDFDYQYASLEVFLPDDLIIDGPIFLETNKGQKYALEAQQSADGLLATADIIGQEFIGLDGTSKAQLFIKAVGRRISLGVVESPRLAIQFFDDTAQRKQIKELLFFDESSKNELDFVYGFARITHWSKAGVERCALSLGLKQKSYPLYKDDLEGLSYTSNYLKQKDFIYFINWGSYELNLIKDEASQLLGKLNRSKMIGLPDSVKSSEFFSHMLEEICRLPISNVLERFAQNPVSNADLKAESLLGASQPLAVLQIVRSLTKELEKMIAAGDKLSSRLVEHQRLSAYNGASRLDQKSLQHLVRNNRFLAAAAHGRPLAQVAPSEIGTVLALHRKDSFGLPENLLLIDVALSMCTVLKRLCEEYEIIAVVFSELEERLRLALRLVCERHDLKMEISGMERDAAKMFALRGKGELARLLELWFRQGSPYGDTYSDWINKISLPNIDDLWELYCLQAILRTLELNGFVYRDTSIGTGSKAEIEFTGANKRATVLYEPKIDSGTIVGGVLNSRIGNSFTPDFVISVEHGQTSKIGIVDAKFSVDPKQHVGRGDEIWGKYGTWLVKENAKPLDYIHAMLPSTEQANYKARRVSGLNLSELGLLAIPPQSSNPDLSVLTEALI